MKLLLPVLAFSILGSSGFALSTPTASICGEQVTYITVAANGSYLDEAIRDYNHEGASVRVCNEGGEIVLIADFPPKPHEAFYRPAIIFSRNQLQ